MPSALHHVTAMTHDLDAVVGFLRDVVGLRGEVVVADGRPASDPAVLASYLGWPEPSDTMRVMLLGDQAAGLVEVVEIPQALRGRVATGLSIGSFLVRDVAGRVAQCREQGITTSEPAQVTGGLATMTLARATVGGVTFGFQGLG